MAPPWFFLHMPRTAGTTLNTLLCQHFSPENVLSVYSQAEYAAHRYLSAEDLAGVACIIGHLLLESTDPPRIYGQPVRVLTLLREPVARLVSEYHFLRTWPNNHMYALLHERNISFAEYIQSGEPRLRYRGKNFMTRCVAGMDVGDDPYPREALAKAKHNLAEVFDFVGIQERFPESLVLLGELLGMENMLHERRNALTEGPPAPSAEDVALVRAKNQADCELYAFACALLDERVAARGAAFTRKVVALQTVNARYQKIADLLRQKARAPQAAGINLPKDGGW